MIFTRISKPTSSSFRARTTICAWRPPARLKALFDGGEFETIAAARGAARSAANSATSGATPTASRMPAARPGSSDAVLVGAGQARRRADRRRRAGFRLHGRLARHGRGRGGHHRHARGRRSGSALHSVRRLRRRAHAGRHALADADAAHHRRRAGAARGEAALHRRADPSDDRRRHRLLRDAGRHPYRRAGRADRLCRPARDRADHPRETARTASSAPNICSSTAWSTWWCIAISCATRSAASAACSCIRSPGATSRCRSARRHELARGARLRP